MSLDRSFQQLLRDLDEMERMLPLAAVRIEQLSGWSIGDHVEHAVNVGDSILKRLRSGAPPDASTKPLNLIGRGVLLIGWIPRGKGRSPKTLVPKSIALDELKSRIAAHREDLSGLSREPQIILRSTVRFPHHIFGTFNARQWVRFMAIHQHHHLKIMRDLASASLR